GLWAIRSYCASAYSSVSGDFDAGQKPILECDEVGIVGYVRIVEQVMRLLLEHNLGVDRPYQTPSINQRPHQVIPAQCHPLMGKGHLREDVIVIGSAIDMPLRRA